MATVLRRSVRVLSRGPAARRREAAGVRIGALFDEFAPMVLAVCRFNLRDPQAAEDAAQETFLNAHRSLLGGTRPRDPAAWLATIARNECRRTRRAASPAPLDEETAGAVLDPADIVAGRAEFSDVASAIAELPARQREALVLREFCGLSYDQVAAAMSVSEAAVDSLLSRARRRLVEQLGEIPRLTHGALVVPASLRDELSRLIPGLDAVVAGTGAGGAVTIASLGSAPVAAKVAATCAAAAVAALPVQATIRRDEGVRPEERPRAVATRSNQTGGGAPAVAAQPVPSPPRSADRRDDGDGSGGTGSGSSGSDSSSSGPGPSLTESGSDSSGPGSDSSGSGSSGSGSSGSDSSGSGSDSSGSDSSGSGSDSSGSGSSGSDSGSGSDDTGSSGSGSGSDSSGSGSDSSGSGSSGSGSGSGEEAEDD